LEKLHTYEYLIQHRDSSAHTGNHIAARFLFNSNFN